MSDFTLRCANLFFAGILAGGELVVYLGVRVPLRQLPQESQLQLRQHLIRRLRVLVPIVFLATLASALFVVMGEGGEGGLASLVSAAGVGALLLFILVTLFGTVPINKGVLDWRSDSLPFDWRATISKWERLDLVRCVVAVSSFALFLVAIGLKAQDS